jgi:hypothetical protein
MAEKTSQPHVFISRGIDQRSAVHNIPVGRSETQYNFDTDSQGFIKKRKGYELHRNIPIRLVNVADRTTNWELVAHPSIDLLGVPSGPIVVNGQAIKISTGELEPVEFYWQQFDNLGAFTLSGTESMGVYTANVTISHAKNLDIMAGILRQDLLDSTNNEAILTDNIENVDNLDTTFQFDLTFESSEQFDASTYTLFSPDDTVVNGSEYADTHTPTTGANSRTVLQSTHGLSGDNFIVQVWQDNVDAQHRRLLIPDTVTINGSGDVTVTFDSDSLEPIHILLVALVDAYQAAQFIDQSVDENDPKQFCLTDVTSNSNLWALYAVDGSGNQTLVMPDKVAYNQAAQTLCFDFYPSADSVFKAVYLPGVPVSAGVIVSKTDDTTTPIDTSLYDLANADLALHGIDWDGIVVSANAPEFAYLREVDEYKSTSIEKLVATASGDLWIEDLVTTYTATASQTAEQAAATQYLTPYFGASVLAQADGRGRGLNATEVSNNRLAAATITNNGDGTATLVSEALTTITGNVSGLTIGIDQLTISGAEFPVYNGTFTISAASQDATTVTVTVTIPDLKVYSESETNTAASMGIFTDFIIMSVATFGNLLVGDEINNLGGLIGNEVIALESGSQKMWLDAVTAERLFPGAVDVSWNRTTDTIFVDDIDGIVPQDVVTISGFSRRFKVLSIDVANLSVTINESITVSNFFGSATTITLDGRLQLPLKPTNNITKDSPFDPTGEYSTELAALNDSLYTTTYDRSVVKFDGTHISDAGIQEFPVYHHSWIVPKVIGTNENDYGFISPNAITGKIKAITATELVILLTDSIPSTLYLKDVISIEDDVGDTITDMTISDIDRDLDQITVTTASTAGFLIDELVSIFEPTYFGYYFRVEYSDRNGKIIVGTPNSYVDSVVKITRPSVIKHDVRLPSTGNGATEWDRLKVAMYRTVGAPSSADITPVFYKVDDTPALKGLTGSKASDAQAIDRTILSDTTSDEALFTSDFVSNAQMSSLGGAAIERPIAAARPPQSQYMLSTGGHMVYGNIKSKPSLLTTWAKNSATVKDLVDTSVTLRATFASVDYDLVTKFVNSSSTNIDVQDITAVIEDTDANGSDFDTTTNESDDVGFLKLTLSGAAVVAGHSSRYVQIISKDATTEALSNDYVGALVGWHKITKVSGTALVWIRVPQFIADEFVISEAVSNLQAVLTTDDIIPCWDVAYADDVPSADVTLPSDVLSRVTRNWAKLVNGVMNDNAYYKRVAEELGTNPTTGLSYDPNYVLGDWCFAKWGQTIGSGNVEVVQQTTDSLTFQILYSGNPSGFEIFSNGYLSSNPVIGLEKVFPSRLVVSYKNYPESVVNPYADDQFKSFSAIDVNASDGEEITGLASFFGQSSTGGAQLSPTIIAFKSNSVYAVNVATKETQKLQSLGQGCTIPDSIASTDDTIFFANDTGIYKVTRDLNVKFVGDLLDKYYGALNKTTLRLRGYGIADNFSHTYKMAVPTGASAVNDELAVYNFESMSKQAEGSWVFHNNIPMSSAKQTNDKFWFGNFKGRIFQIRDTGNVTDYRDDDAAINATFTYAPQAFGDIGRYKKMSHVIVQFDGAGPSAVQGEMALDLSSDFTALDTAVMGSGNWKGVSVAYSPPPANAVFYQLKLSHNVIDEDCVINGLAFKIEPGSEAKIRQASDGADGTKKS